MKQPISNTHPNDETWGTQDAGGWGLLGIWAGVVIGFFVAYLFGVPLFPKDRGTLNLTLMTSLVTAAMTAGGVVGYLLTRHRR